MTYNPNADRDYWRSAGSTRLIEAARDSGHELAIALGERLEATEPDALRADDLENECDTLKREVEALEDELENFDKVLDDTHAEIAELKALLADQMGCAK